MSNILTKLTEISSQCDKILKMIELCTHHNESPFMTTEKRVCPVCGKIYYYDDTPINWGVVATSGKKPMSEGV